MNLRFPLAGVALGWPLALHSLCAHAAPPEDTVPAAAPARSIGVVVIEAGAQPTSLPTQIPTTMEGITREQIDRTVNATDSEDALRYFPSLLVRKRYIGDYNHAVLSSRASGTGNSARSAVYADGILLSNYLGNGVGGLSFPPRWGLVTPEEIERVDVMYGPFSAAYAGNSAGAVVDFTTRMPTRFEAHAQVGGTLQPFHLDGTDARYRSGQASASVGNRSGDWAWWVNAHRTDSESQPLTFATRLAGSGSAGPGGTAVTGAVAGASNSGQPWFVLGTGTQVHTVQDHLKVKLAYDATPTVRASVVLGLWQNTSEGHSESTLRDAAGQTVTSGPITIGGSTYSGSQALSGADFPLTREQLVHTMQGLSIKSHSRGVFDWELAASRYDYQRDDKRQNSAANPLPQAEAGGPGTLADGSGTGWTTLALKGTWRPEAAAGRHVVDFGLQQDRYELHYRTSAISGNYRSDAPGALVSSVEGRTELQGLWAQDAWQFADDWKAVLGARAEHWQASDGRTDFSASSALTYPSRRESFVSPKAALSWQALDDTVLKASLGRAVRVPTVGELYGATSTTNSQSINDPELRPERSWTGELSAEREFGRGSARLTLFTENTHDALYSQTTFDAAANRNVSRVQNIGRIATQGVEAAFHRSGWLLPGLDLQASLTYTDSRINENAGFVVTPGDTLGKWQPNIPRWRATAQAGYRFDADWTGSLGVRTSGRQYRTLNNADVHGDTYQGVSAFTVVDARVRWQIDRAWSAAFGIDNLTNDRYWNFHPYPQRSYSAELRYDL